MCSGRAKLKFALNFLNCFVQLALLQGSKCLIIEVTCGNGHIINSSVVYQGATPLFFWSMGQPKIKFDTGGVREERFEELVYHQGASIR
jgi:hypothetical protein